MIRLLSLSGLQPLLRQLRFHKIAQGFAVDRLAFEPGTHGFHHRTHVFHRRRAEFGDGFINGVRHLVFTG